MALALFMALVRVQGPHPFESQLSVIGVVITVSPRGL